MSAEEASTIEIELVGVPRHVWKKFADDFCSSPRGNPEFQDESLVLADVSDGWLAMERAELLPSSFAKLLVLYPREVFGVFVWKCRKKFQLLRVPPLFLFLCLGFRFVRVRERERETMVTRDRKRSTKLVPNRRPHLGGPTSTKERIFFSRCNFRRKNNERVASQKEMLGDRSEIERMSSSSTYPSTPYIIINVFQREPAIDSHGLCLRLFFFSLISPPPFLYFPSRYLLPIYLLHFIYLFFRSMFEKFR